MSIVGIDNAAWMDAIERVLAPLVESATADRIGLPTLTNEAYRALAEQAQTSSEARTVFDNYLLKLNSNPTDLINLLSEHPAVSPNLDDTRKNVAAFVDMPGKGFRMPLSSMARHLVQSAMRRGCRGAATHLNEFLTLSAEERVPGYEIVVFLGLAVSGEVEIAPGLEIISYQSAAERGLVRNEPPGPTNDMPDYVGMDAFVLARAMTWGPCLVPPGTIVSPLRVSLKAVEDSGKCTMPTFRWLPGLSSGIVFDFLSIVVSHRVQVLSILSCAPEFVDVDPNFGPGSSVSFIHDDHWGKKNLTSERVRELQKLLSAWSAFEESNCDTLELAVSRLASAIRRDRGRFWTQDRILDATISLELMYCLQPPELTYKLATRAGHLLGATTDKRIETFEKVISLYKARSSIVHGSRRSEKTKKENANPQKVAASGIQIAKETLYKLLELGDFPHWNELVMS